jgi:hypothetical protein
MPLTLSGLSPLMATEELHLPKPEGKKYRDRIQNKVKKYYWRPVKIVD